MLYTSALWILAAASVLTLLALLEFNNLSLLKIRDTRSDILGVVLGLAQPVAFYFYGALAALPLLLGSVFIFFFYNMVRSKDLKDASYDIGFKALGIAYIAIPLSYLISLRRIENGEWWILLLLIIIWANDTFAFFTGKTIGKSKLAPEISPKKTIEGVIGGLLGGAVAALLYNYFLSMGISALETVILSVIIGVIGVIGDLAESLLKRAAGVKDSGTLIPGHGGVLDRIDSLIFPIPVLYFILVCPMRVAG